MKRAVLAVVCLGMFSSSIACDPGPPDLLEVFDATPRQIESNDVLVFRGSGYPPGEVGVVEFNGALYRAGSEPDESFHFDAEVRSESNERAVLVMDQAAVAAFTDGEHGPRHATFRGSATVSFAPNLDGAPPIRGSGPVLVDVYPPSELREARLGSTLGEFYGAEFADGPLGVEVVSVVAQGRLESAGLEGGDQIRAFDGLSTLVAADLQPRAGQRWAVLEVQRGAPGAVHPPRLHGVDVEGYRPKPASAWTWALALLLPLSLLVLLSQCRFAHGWAWLSSRALGAPDAQRSAPGSGDALPEGFVAFLAVSVLFVAARLDLVRGIADLDLALLYVSATVLEFAAHFLAGGQQPRGFSALRALGAMFSALPQQLALALVVLATVLERASLGLGTNTGLGWDVGPWASPSAFLSCGVLSVLALGRRQPLGSGRGTGRLLEILDRSTSLLLIGAVIALFFGGWHTPSWLRGGSTVSIVWFELQLTLGYTLWLVVRRTTTRLGVILTARFASWVLLPLALAAVMLAPAWLAEVWPDWFRQTVRAALLTLMATALLSTLVLALRGRRGSGQSTAVNPWL